MLELFFYPVFDFFFLTWAFWLFFIVCPLFIYFSIANSLEDNNYTGAPLFWGPLLLFAISWHWPTLGHFFLSWSHWMWLIGGYVVAGFLVSTYKWVMVLRDFRAGDTLKNVARIKQEATAKYAKHNVPMSDVDLRSEIEERLSGDKYVITVDNATVTVYPDWREHPIATWWTYWPYFILDVVADPLRRVIVRIVNRLRLYFEHIAQHFKVSV